MPRSTPQRPVHRSTEPRQNHSGRSPDGVELAAVQAGQRQQTSTRTAHGGLLVVMSHLPSTVEHMSDTAVARRMRGPNQGRAWSRQHDTDGDLGVFRLALDVGDPLMRRRVERLFGCCFQIRRALQRDARSRVDAYWAAHRERAASPAAVRDRLGLSRKSLEVAAKRHLDAAPHLKAGCTKALGLHLADSVWAGVERHLFGDSSGRRAGRPKVGRWWGFARLPGRAKSHTTARKWETFRLHGTLEGHRAAYTHQGSFYQPSKMRPVACSGSWWDHDGPFAVVMTGLEIGELVLPVRLPAAPGNQAALDWYLADPEVWHKIDLVRHRDPHAAGGWRYETHLTVLKPAYTSPATVGRRRQAGAVNRKGGVDVNVSNVTIVSFDPHGDQAHATELTRTAGHRKAAKVEQARRRGRQRALDRSRRAANPDQYHRSRNQKQRDRRRAEAGLPPVTTEVPTGPRKTRADGKPVRAYRRDRLTNGYRRGRSAQAAEATSQTQARRNRARQIAAQVVAEHGPRLVVEDSHLPAWARQWGKALHAFQPGTLLAALDRETAAAAGQQAARASTFTTALSQHCLCGTRIPKALAERRHACPHCGVDTGRDVMAAAHAAHVVFDDPNDPHSAHVDWPSAHTTLQWPATWVILARFGRQDAPTESTAPSPDTGPSGDGRERPPAPAGSARRTPARHRPQPHTSPAANGGTAVGRERTRPGMPRNPGARTRAPDLRDIS